MEERALLSVGCNSDHVIYDPGTAAQRPHLTAASVVSPVGLRRRCLIRRRWG